MRSMLGRSGDGRLVGGVPRVLCSRREEGGDGGAAPGASMKQERAASDVGELGPDGHGDGDAEAKEQAAAGEEKAWGLGLGFRSIDIGERRGGGSGELWGELGRGRELHAALERASLCASVRGRRRGSGLRAGVCWAELAQLGQESLSPYFFFWF